MLTIALNRAKIVLLLKIIAINSKYQKLEKMLVIEGKYEQIV